MPSLTDVVALLLADLVADGTDTGGAGVVRIYEGTVPATADTSLSGQTELVAVTLNDPGYDDAAMVGSDAVADMSVTPAKPKQTIAIPDTATFARIEDGNGLVRRQWSITATGGGGTLEVPSTALTQSLLTLE